MKVFLSFVGLGTAVRDQANPARVVDHKYDAASYRFPGHEPGAKTPYVQRAIVEALIKDGNGPDMVLIAMTPGSRQWQWEKPGRLRDRLLELDPMRSSERIEEINISEDLEVRAQWTTFQAILERVPRGCQLYVDLTHGFRAMPILFSAAIHFLTHVKEVNLAGAFYGAYEPRKKGPFPIVDMKDFFTVNRWAEAVRSVVQDANPALMAELAETQTSLQFDGLGDEDLIRGLERLGSMLRNADTKGIATTADKVMPLIRRGLQQANPASKLLLELVLDKFQELARVQGARRFSADWYEVQLQMAQMLLKHGLVMQGLTVLRELVVSWGEEIATRALNDPDNAGRKQFLSTHSQRELRRRWLKQARRKVAEPFFERLHRDAGRWNPRDTDIDPDGSLVRGFLDAEFASSFAARKENGEFEFLNELRELRNQVNHAWTNKSVADHDTISERARACYEPVERLTRELVRESVIGRGMPPD